MTEIEHHQHQGEIDGSVGAVETGPEVPTVSAFQVLFGNRWAVLLDMVLPFAGYQVLAGRGVPTVIALSATAIFPLAGTLGGWLRERRLDALGVISLVFIAGGLIATLIISASESTGCCWSGRSHMRVAELMLRALPLQSFFASPVAD
ncbi:MAG: hypothetical protein ACR2JC_20295 [Chloroflexota bacterium]|nr:MAG: hypothetical protein DLM70_11120 [Chloroflexota bacterium]